MTHAMLGPTAAGARDVSDYMSKYAIKDSSPADFFGLCEWFGRPWGQDDEYYFLAQRFVPWCTPYSRSIDRPINIPRNILPKYALHSRAMHYFVPYVMAWTTASTPSC
jgi:hypothetical protein